MARTQGAKPAKASTRPNGRPSRYRSEFAEQAYTLCAKGFLDSDLADFFKVSETTINNWKLAYPEFLESIKTGKDEFDVTVVEAALKHRATGYSHPAVDIRVVNGELVQTTVTKHYPPDTSAAIFFLKNRNPARWRDKQQLEHDVAEASPMLALLKSISGNAIRPGVDCEMTKI